MPDAERSDLNLVEIVEKLGHQQIVAYMDVVGAVLCIYEVMINFHIKVEHIWMRKWSFVTVLYILQRYLPLADTTGLIFHVQFGTNLSIHYCSLTYKIAGWSHIVGFVLSEVLLTIRVWAVWNRSARVAVGLVAFFLVCWASNYRVIFQYMDSIEFATLPFPNFRGCFVANQSTTLFVNWILLTVYDTGTFVMILIPGVASYRRGGRSELLKTIYRDGRITCIFFAHVSNLEARPYLLRAHTLNIDDQCDRHSHSSARLRPSSKLVRNKFTPSSPYS
ncbi:hypothetical protein L218DRAFT_995316 [Marasmius fiardii PR-910]|nr:hypothetical protein L218DRAFT_995316 [Marasmius fiardii PR-910]